MVDWKKEIKLSDLRRKPKDGAPDAPAVEPAPATPAGDAREQTSFWKKEISFSRKQRPAREVPAESAPAVAAAPPGEPEPAVPFWKKEISFSRKKSAAPPVGAAEPAAIDLPVAYDHEALEADVAAALDLVNAYLQQPTAVEAASEPAEADEPGLAEAAAEPVVELFAAPDPAPADEPDEPMAVLPAASLDVTPSAAAAPPLAEAPRVAAVPGAQAEPVVVHPPVPAAALPPLEDEPKKKEKRRAKKEKNKQEGPAGERVPFYKRELSFGRKQADKPAKPPRETKPKRARTEKPAASEQPKRARRTISLPRPQPRGAKAGGKLPKRLVGLKIGSSQVAAATVDNNGHAEVVQVARAALEPGVVSNGELRDPDLLADALREFFKEHNLPRRGVRLGIATNRIGVRTLEISGIEDPKQLANAIKFRAQEALPIPIDEAVLDYQVLREDRNEDGESTRKILLVLAYRDLIDRYVDACRKAGIQLVGIDLEAFALVRALAAPRPEDTPAQSALVVVTIGHDRATFAVSDGRVCEFTRVLDWGGQSLNVAIARALDMSPSEVDGIKRSLSVDGTEVPAGITPEQAQTARDALRKQVQSFARELVSSLQFYQNQPGSLGIGEIVITGGTAHLSGLADELQRLIGVRVRVGDPLVRVKAGDDFEEPDQLGSLAVAIGLGIED